jgi:hypothetical protein
MVVIVVQEAAVVNVTAEMAVKIVKPPFSPLEN